MLVSTDKRPGAAAGSRTAFRDHWPEYAIEGTCLGLFMISACGFGTLLSHPDSPIVRLIGDAVLLRVLMGIAMGSTAVALIYSRQGKRSGAHMNPAVTLTFLRLAKVERWDAFFYAAAQFAGAVIGVALAGVALRGWLAHPPVEYVVTLPGAWGDGWAFAAEAAMTFVLMSVVLKVSNTPRLNRYTGVAAGVLVMLYIAIEAPVSGMSMNPARSFGSAFAAANWKAIWIYFTAPPLGMGLAAELYVRLHGMAGVLCAKMHHENKERCIFRCNYPVPPVGAVIGREKIGADGV